MSCHTLLHIAFKENFIASPAPLNLHVGCCPKFTNMQVQILCSPALLMKLQPAVLPGVDSIIYW